MSILSTGQASEDEAAVARTTAALLDAVNRSDLAGVIAVWADDGVLMPPHHPSVRGRVEIERYFRQLFEQTRLTFSFTASQIHVSENIAVERVEYAASSIPAQGGAETRDVGKGLHVYRRQASGPWRLAMDIWNSDTPARMDVARLKDFGARYTAAWCSQNAASVASFFCENGSLTINDGTPSVGRAAITSAAQSFMTAFPDMVVTMDGLNITGDVVIYEWTLAGTNTGIGGTGRPVRISGYEAWTFDPDGLIADSKGHFDEEEYNRQLRT